MKTNRAEKARETLKILDRGWYYLNDIQIDIAQEVYDSKKNTQLHSPEALAELRNSIPSNDFATKIEVFNETTMQGALALDPIKNKIGVLNFASAKNPGGGFMGGAQAQEESLARSSSLYVSIEPMQEMYKFNASSKTYLYSDYMIYSQGVVFFRNDDLELIEPYQVDVLTSPAVNVGAILQNKRSERALVDEVMIQRMDKMLALFVKNGITHIVLGAWGCGVFRNEPADVVGYFKDFLFDGGKYAAAFEHIRFSVLDPSDRGTFDCFTQLRSND